MTPLGRAATLPVILAILTLAPFLDGAFVIDDTLFLAQARHALSDPLHPTAFTMAWNNPVPERVSTMMPSGAVAAWLLVPAVAAGGAEWIAHGTVLLLFVLAVIATVSIALELGLAVPWASAAGVLLVTTPAVLGMAGTAMPDVPAMALGIVGLERLVVWERRGGSHRAIFGAVLLGLAALTRSHLAALLVIGPALLLARAWRTVAPGSAPRPGGTRAPAGRDLLALGRVLARIAWPVALAAAVILGIALVTRDPARSGGGLLSSAATLSDAWDVPFNLTCFGAHWTLATTFAVSWLALRLPAAIRRWWLFAAACLFFVALHWVQVDVEGSWLGRSHWRWVVPVAGLGTWALGDVLLDGVSRRDAVQLVLGAWLLVPLPLVVYIHLPSKYLIASAPAACLLVARLAEERPRFGRWVVGAAAGAGLVLGVGIVRAEVALGEVARSGISRLVTPGVTSGRTLWYDGHWGFEWYAVRAGARPWNATTEQPRPGDLILTNTKRSAPLDRDVYRALVHLQRYEDRTPGGRVMSDGAGFFSNGWGVLPWAWGDDLIDAVDLWLAPGGPLPPPAPRQQIIRASP